MAVNLKIVSQVVTSGTPGPVGKSAYKIAVDNGFEGTESEWLKELHPFKGWFDSVSELEEEHSAPSVGEYAYVKGAASSDPVKIYECSTEGSWSDSGRTVDTSTVQTFRSGESVNDVDITDDSSDIEENSDKIPTAGAVADALGNAEFSTGEKVKNVGIDNEPTFGSDNLVKSGGVFEEVNQLDQEVAKKVYKMCGKNLLDLSTLTLNKSFTIKGDMIYNPYYHITDFIPCEQSTTYCYSRKGSTTNPGGSQYVVFYNSSKERISQLLYSGITFTTPAEAAFMRNTLYKDYAPLSNETMIEKGTSRTSYERYNPIAGYPIENGAVGLNQIDPSIVDATPTKESTNLVTSGGVYNLISSLAGAQYGGIATPSTIPATIQGHFYLANTAGIYTNFDGIGLESGESAFLFYNGAIWSKQTIKKDERKKLYVEQEIDLTPTNWSILGDTSVQTDNGGLKISCVENGSNKYHFASIPLTSTIDVSNSWIGIDFDILEGSGTSALSTIDSINIILSTYDSFTVSSWYSMNAQYSLLVNAAYIGYAGNYKTSVSLYTQHNNRTLSIDKTAIKSIGVLIRTKAETGTPSIRVNKLFTYRKPEEAQVIIGFDNIYATQQNALDYLKANGFRGTLFFGAATVGQTTRFTLSELKSLQEDGHLLASYGKIYPQGSGDPVAWYDMSLSQKISAIRAQVNWHYKNGFGKGARCFSTPAGGWSADEAILWESGLVSLITGRINYANDGRAIGYYGRYAQGHSCGPSAKNADETQTAGRFSVIDSICANGGFAIFIFHNVNGEASQDITLQEFKDFVDYVKTKSDAGLLEVVTADKLSVYELSEPNI